MTYDDDEIKVGTV